MSITFIVPTIGRESLGKTLLSIEPRQGDEVIIVSDHSYESAFDIESCLVPGVHWRFLHCPRGNDWGHAERNYATPFAHNRYIAHIDDDDIYAPGTRALMQDAIERTPDRPVIFRMRFPNGITLWDDPVIRCGNVGTPMFLLPNELERFGTWQSFVGGDCAFLEGCKWEPEDFVWRPEVIALLGHNT